MKKERLTETQEQVLSLIRAGINIGHSPSVEEIRCHFGWASPNSAQCHINALARKGYILLGRGKARSITIIHTPDVFDDAALWGIWPSIRFHWRRNW